MSRGAAEGPRAASSPSCRQRPGLLGAPPSHGGVSLPQPARPCESPWRGSRHKFLKCLSCRGLLSRRPRWETWCFRLQFAVWSAGCSWRRAADRVQPCGARQAAHRGPSRAPSPAPRAPPQRGLGVLVLVSLAEQSRSASWWGSEGLCTFLLWGHSWECGPSSSRFLWMLPASPDCDPGQVALVSSEKMGRRAGVWVLPC